jgi:hypothetical protein
LKTIALIAILTLAGCLGGGSMTETPMPVVPQTPGESGPAQPRQSPEQTAPDAADQETAPDAPDDAPVSRTGAPTAAPSQHPTTKPSRVPSAHPSSSPASAKGKKSATQASAGTAKKHRPVRPRHPSRANAKKKPKPKLSVSSP